MLKRSAVGLLLPFLAACCFTTFAQAAPPSAWTANGPAIAQAAYGEGFRGDDLIEMVAIAGGESQWGSLTAPGSQYQGPWSMNVNGYPSASIAPEPDPTNTWDSAQEAHELFSHYLSAGYLDPASGSTLPAPNLPQVTSVAWEDGQGYLPATVYSPWTDFAPNSNAYQNYETALSLANAHISSWVPEWAGHQSPAVSPKVPRVVQTSHESVPGRSTSVLTAYHYPPPLRSTHRRHSPSNFLPKATVLAIFLLGLLASFLLLRPVFKLPADGGEEPEPPDNFWTNWDEIYG